MFKPKKHSKAISSRIMKPKSKMKSKRVKGIPAVQNKLRENGIDEVSFTNEKKKKLNSTSALPSKNAKETDSSEDGMDVYEDEDNHEQETLQDKDSSDDDSLSGADRSDGESEEEFNEDEHKKSLLKLKETDPEFYNFLKENDKNLLDFQPESEGSEDESVINDTLHKVDGTELDIASDESDFEPDEGGADESKNLTLKLIKKWEQELQSENKISIKTLSNVIKAFNAAMLTVSSDEEKSAAAAFKVEGSAVFNAVVQMCVMYLHPALKKYLGIENRSKEPQKCKHWVKLRNKLKFYLTDLLKLLGGVTSANILVVLLKHLHQMTPFIACYPRIIKPLFKRLLVLWSSSEETVRVLAFMCLLRITRNQQQILLDSVLKMMYMTYVKNCKFVSPGTWPGINFMRRSLIEMFALDLNMSYNHVFLYIRQLAIHLRNATIVNKKENVQAVYNWQFVNSLHLWADLLGATSNKPQLQPLIYPLTMIMVNTIKLVPTAQYYPLRFHVVRILAALSKDSGTFIPILPFLLEVLTAYDFNKKHKKVSMKPMDFSCILRLSKSQLSENGFKDAVIDTLYELLLEYSANESHSIAFPDLILPCTLQLKHFLKTCSVGNYCKKIRQILEKIEESSKFIENARKKITFSLADTKLINSWETTTGNKGTPLTIFYDNWYKINKNQKRKNIKKTQEIATELPKIKKLKKVSGSKEEGPVELFPSDSDEEVQQLGKEPLKTVPKQKRKKRRDKKEKSNAGDVQNEEADDEKTDIVKAFNMKDW